jgi:alcohol dehydrogenase class IV
MFAENWASLVVAEVKNVPNSGVLDATLLVEIPAVMVAVTAVNVITLPMAEA